MVTKREARGKEEEEGRGWRKFGVVTVHRARGTQDTEQDGTGDGKACVEYSGSGRGRRRVVCEKEKSMQKRTTAVKAARAPSGPEMGVGMRE